MFGSFEVKGDATEASSSEREIPTDARLSAAQSFAPSPQKQQTKSRFSNLSTSEAFFHFEMDSSLRNEYQDVIATMT